MKWNDNNFSACIIIIITLKDTKFTVLWEVETESETSLLHSNHYGVYVYVHEIILFGRKLSSKYYNNFLF